MKAAASTSQVKVACSCFYGPNSKSVQPIVMKPDSNDPIECLLSFESPCSAFHYFLHHFISVSILKEQNELH